MAEVTNELLYEVLKTLQERMSRMEGKLDEIKGELTAMRGYIYAVHQDVGNIYSVLAKHDLRLDRIERRLELREPELT